MLALGSIPTHETVWARGAGGEERVAKFLAKYHKADAVALHDRAIRGSRANIDHLVIAPSGVGSSTPSAARARLRSASRCSHERS
jgi:hypothetical protein